MEKMIKQIKATKKETAFKRERRVCSELKNILDQNKILSSLTPEQREVLIKKDVNNENFKQLKVSINTVKKTNFEGLTMAFQTAIQTARNFERKNNLIYQTYEFKNTNSYYSYYTVAKKIIITGYINKPDSVLIEEFISEWKEEREISLKKEEKKLHKEAQRQAEREKDKERTRLQNEKNKKKQLLKKKKEDSISKVDILAQIRKLTQKLESANIK